VSSFPSIRGQNEKIQIKIKDGVHYHGIMVRNWICHLIFHAFLKSSLVCPISFSIP